MQGLIDRYWQRCLPADAAWDGAGTAGLGKPPAAVVAALAAGEASLQVRLADANGETRVLWLAFPCAADWPAIAALADGVQADLRWPAPLVSVSPEAGFALCFPLAEPLPQATAQAVLNALAARWLADLPAARRPQLPPAITLVPAYDAGRDLWSAFIDPGLGSMFIDTPGLDLPPSPGRQADLISAAAPLTRRDIDALLADAAPAGRETLVPPAQPVMTDEARLAVGGGYTDPRDFLRAVMNDPTARARDRIRAATALLRFGGEAP